jgi:glycosyltransferase involved in cell wall biosynthesis
MNIGFIATRLAGVDGVSLETEKIARVLTQMGHNCFYCAGELDDQPPYPGMCVPAMHFTDPVAKEIHDEVFSNSTPEAAIFQRIYDVADTIRQSLEAFVDEYDIDVIVPQNASTIPMNISLGVAISDLVRRRRIKTICHHHDFYWERERFINNGIQDILTDAFPPHQEPIRHLTISTVMQRRLYAWRGIRAHYLPNVFDFANPPPFPDDYAKTFRDEIGLSEDDLIVLQPTRIIRRKAIEKAIELVRKLDDDRLVLIITGYEGDEPGEYGSWLREEAGRSGIRYKFIGDRVGAARGEHNGQRVFTLWDIYPHAHFITYPSTYEGFGNALIETLYFRKPLIVHTYPQYVADIKSAGVRAVEFHHDITQDVLAQTREMIDNATWRESVTTHNYQVGLEHFSLKVVHRTLSTVLDTFADS